MSKLDTDPQTTEFQLRPGAPPFGGAGWRGVDTESDPGSLDPNQLQRGDNLRLRGKNLVNRPGNTLKIDLGNSQTILHLHEAPVDNPRVRLWLIARGCFGQTIGTGAQIAHYDPSQSPALQVYGYYFAETSRQAVIGAYGDKLFIGDKSALREVVQLTPVSGVSVQSLITTPPQVPTAIFTGFTIRWLKEFDGRLYIGLENDSAPASSKIAVYNGKTVVDDLTGVRPPIAVHIWRNKLVVGFDATAAHLRYRDAGTPPGTWTTVALAGFLTASQGNAMQEVRQYLYIASGTDLIHRFDGAALSLVRTVAGADTTGYGVTSLTLHNGLLHYGWNAAATFNSKVGRHDPDSTGANEWVDTYKDVTADQANFKRLSALASYRQQIYAGGDQNWLVATAVNDVKGTIEVINSTGAPGAGFEILQLMRFP